MNISNNIASIGAHQTMLNNSAHNVANVNSDGFIPNGTTISENANAPKANTHKADDTGSPRSETDLAKEIPDQIVASGGVSANVSVIKTQNEMLGSLLDMKA